MVRPELPVISSRWNASTSSDALPMLFVDCISGLMLGDTPFAGSKLSRVFANGLGGTLEMPLGSET